MAMSADKRTLDGIRESRLNGHVHCRLVVVGTRTKSRGVKLFSRGKMARCLPVRQMIYRRRK
jgi:hypothetical protein